MITEYLIFASCSYLEIHDVQDTMRRFPFFYVKTIQGGHYGFTCIIVTMPIHY